MPGPLIFYAIYKGIAHKLNKANTLDELFTPENRDIANKLYRNQIGLGQNFKFDNTPFTDYAAARTKSIENLPSIFGNKLEEPLKKQFQDALKDSAVKSSLDSVLKPHAKQTEGAPGSLTTAEKDYQQKAAAFTQLAKKIPPLKVEAVIQTMTEIIDKGVKDITAQQLSEKTKLESLIQSKPFKDKLIAAGIKESDIPAIQKAMKADLVDTHKTQLKSFEDATAKSKNQLHSAAQADLNKYPFIQALSNSSDEMREIIRLQAEKNRVADLKAVNEEISRKTQLLGEPGLTKIQKDQLTSELKEAEVRKKAIADRNGPLEAVADKVQKAHDQDPNVGYVHLSQLTIIKSRTGKTIKQDEPGVFKLEFGATMDRREIVSGYFMGNKVGQDLRLLAEGVKAGGKKSIIMDIDYSNEDMAKKRAKQAYEACIEAGFPPEKIKVNVTVNGKKIEWKPEQELGPQYEVLKQRSAELQKGNAAPLKFEKPKTEHTAQAKEELEKILVDIKQQEAVQKAKEEEESQQAAARMFDEPEQEPRAAVQPNN